ERGADDVDAQLHADGREVAAVFGLDLADRVTDLLPAVEDAGPGRGVRCRDGNGHLPSSVSKVLKPCAVSESWVAYVSAAFFTSSADLAMSPASLVISPVITPMVIREGT